MSRGSETRTGESVETRARKRPLSLELLEVYEVTDRPPEADLDAAEIVLAGMLVDCWLQTRGDSTAESNPRQIASDSMDSQDDREES